MSRSLFEEMKRLLSPSKEVVFECRRCGKSLDERPEQCPECGSEAVSQYEF